MSDKFDKDDFSWLRDNGDNQPEDDDFPDLDWLTDTEDRSSSPAEKRLGVTGQLPWLGDQDKTTEDEESAEDSFDWLKSSDTPAAPDSRRLGVTGELSWLGGKEDTEDDVLPPGTTQADWRKASFEDQLEAAERAAGIDWGLDASDESTYSPADDTEAEIPEWLRGAEPDDDEDEFPEETPSWLQDTNTQAANVSEEPPSWMTGVTFDNEAETLVEDDEDPVPPAWMVDVPEDINETPSWLTGVTRSAEISADDLETEAGLSNLFGDDLFADVEPDDFDLLAELTSEPASTGLTDLLNPDVVAEEPTADEADDFDLLRELEAPQQISSQDDDLDWLRDFEPETSPASNQQTEIQDIDDFLAGLGTGELEFEEDFDQLGSAEVEFDDLFTDNAAMQQMGNNRPDLPDLTTPEWLSGVSISEVSAAALVRKQQDRPLEDLPERLQMLHEEGLHLPASTPSPSAGTAIRELIPDLGDALPPAPIEVGGAAGIAEKLALTPDQTRRVGILTGLTGASAAAAQSALDESASRAGRRISIKLDRLLMTLLIVAAVLLPFFGIARVGDLPPSAFSAGSRQQMAFDRVEALPAESLVLFAVEYGATGAGELDSFTDALLRHVFLRGARPVIVSSNPVGLLRADNQVSEIAGSTLVKDQDYFVGRYIAGATLGLRAFSQDVSALTGLDIASLNDFALIVVIAENTDSVRTWSEQVAPLTDTPLIFASSYAASPIALPYNTVTSTGGLLVGYGDAYTYARLVEALAAESVPVIPPVETETPTETPVEATPTEEVEVLPTEEPTAESTLLATPTIQADEETSASTVTPEATSTDAPTATRTPLPSPTSTTADEVIGTVSAQQAVNVRQGPGSDFPVVDVLQPGDRVAVIGANEDDSWYNIRLEDGTEGWISAQLLELPEARMLPPSRRGLAMNVSWRVEQAATATPGTSTAVLMRAPTYEDERWYGMTLGIVTIAIIIAVGNLLSVIRRLLSTRRQRGR
jgi:SH3-like domain-containing protein